MKDATSLRLGLQGTLLDSAFPFHLLLDPELRILRQGSTLKRILPLEGTLLTDAFLLESPRVPLTASSLARSLHSIFLLRSKTRPLLLRGQMIQAEEPGYFLCLCSPNVEELKDLEILGLTLDDFAIHDVVAEFLTVVQSKNEALRDLRSANRQLLVQRQVDQVLSGAQDLRSVLVPLLKAIGAPLGWTRGAAWDQGAEPPLRLCTWGNFPAQTPGVRPITEAVVWERDGERVRGLGLRLPEPALILEWSAEVPIPYDPNFDLLLQEVLQELGQAVERWSMDQQLRETEARRAAIMFASLDAILTTDHAWRILEANPAAQFLFGWSLSEVEGRRLEEVLLPVDRRVEWRLTHQPFEMEVVARNGQKLPVEVTIVLGSEDRSRSYIVFLKDLTPRKRAEMALREAAQQAESASRAKSDFLAHFSHELRTPMNAILGMADIAQESPSLPEIRECLSRIQRNGEMMREHIAGILDFSKIEAGEMDMEDRVFDLVELVEGVVESLALRADQKEMNLYCTVDPEVPERIWGDPHRTQQVLINLVGNAIKFTDRGEVWVEVNRESSHTLHLAVHDTGIGLSPNDLKHITEKFWRSERARSYAGTGLGLSISRSIVERLGGRIDIESTLGKGTHFHVRLPLRAEPSSSPSPAPSYRIRVSLDHGPTAQTALQTLLKKGFEVGTEARVPRAHLWITDVDQPDRMQKALRAQEWGTQVLGVLPLGKAMPGKEKLRGILHKPFGPRRLMQEVERLLDLQPPVTLDPVAPPLPDRPYRVLVVEDTEDNYRFFQHVLSRAGYQVDLAFNGVEAVQKAEAYSYALILMDLEMPVMGGLEAARQIRAYEQENERIRVPIVAVTAHAIEEFRQRCKEAGMDDYATKPIQRTPLLERVSRWINPRPLVLMVDDAPDGREVFRRFLEKDNRVRVLTAPDGYQALQIFAQNRVDAVVVDLEMPKMDGFTLIAALREQVPKGLPIVALTGHTGLEIRRRCEEAGCAGYLVKPASRKEVLDTMYRLLFGTGSLH